MPRYVHMCFPNEKTARENHPFLGLYVHMYEHVFMAYLMIQSYQNLLESAGYIILRGGRILDLVELFNHD